MNMKDYLLCPTHLSHIIMVSGRLHFGQEQAFLFLPLCMEHCEGTLLPELVPSLSLKDLLRILFSTGEVLAYLLENGILYTDLHPSNLLIRTTGQHRMVTLLDFTYCYYFLNNPKPPYTLRFSYNLSPDLKGPADVDSGAYVLSPCSS